MDADDTLDAGLFSAVFGQDIAQYQNAAQQYKDTSQQMQNQLQNAGMANSSGMFVIGGGAGGGGNGGGHYTVGWTDPRGVFGAGGSGGNSSMPPPLKTVTDINHPAMQPSLDVIENLWLVKYGDGWIKKETVLDDFYQVAAQRLANAHRMERHMDQNFITEHFRLICKS